MSALYLKKFSENSLPAKWFSVAAMLAKKRRKETGNENNNFKNEATSIQFLEWSREWRKRNYEDVASFEINKNFTIKEWSWNPVDWAFYVA